MISKSKVKKRIKMVKLISNFISLSKENEIDWLDASAAHLAIVFFKWGNSFEDYKKFMDQHIDTARWLFQKDEELSSKGDGK